MDKIILKVKGGRENNRSY